jgi:hypothetical protein
MLKRFALVSLASAALLVGCGSKTPDQNGAETEGIATSSTTPADAYKDLGRYLKNADLRRFMDAKDASFWFYTKDFNSEGSADKDINVCVYAAEVERSQSLGSDPKDRKRFLNNAKVLKGGKYISWNKFTLLLSNLADQKPNSLAAGKIVSNQIAVGMKEMKEAIKIERKRLTSGVDVLETMQPLSRTLKPGWVAGGLYTAPQYLTVDDKNTAALAALLIALDRVPTSESACPGKETVSKRIKAQ